MSIDKEKLKDGLKTAFNSGVDFVKEATPYVMDGLKLAGQVANSLLGNSSSSSGSNNSKYTLSNQTQQYQTQMNNLQKPTQQNSQWQQQLNDTMNAILNREKFSYDLNGDALYQQYKDQYALGGQMAMQDTMGQAAAMTGGYGNSYAQTVGQQQYQGYLQQLNDRIPELYQLALNTYNQETADLYNRYGMLSDAEAQEYARYRDQMSDYYTDRDYLANQYYNERDFDYNKYVDDRNYQYQLDRDKVSDSQWQKQYDRAVLESDRQYQYQLDRDAISDERYNTEWQYQLGRDAVSDKRYDSEWQYQLDRDKVADKWQQKNFDESVRQYNESLAENKRQANQNYELQKKKINSGTDGGATSSQNTKPNQNPSQNQNNEESYANDDIDIRADLLEMAREGATHKQLRDFVDAMNNEGALNTMEYKSLCAYCDELAIPTPLSPFIGIDINNLNATSSLGRKPIYKP